jgi:hypothetical protein
MGGRVVFETLMGDYSPVYAEPSAAPAPKARLAERLPAPPTFRDEQSTRLVVRWRRDVHGERREGGRTGEKEENIIIGARTEEEEARGAAGEASVDQPTQREVDRRLPLGVHAQLGRTGRHDSTHRCRSK